ncbi:ThiF family adenylyltransferase [Streptomyces labedae]|uniref:ThiF family adenylyltransferase n=1 Tax=Streptomyces labedae TaxID=285569 RepID=A0ABP6QNT2_9ACTN
MSPQLISRSRDLRRLQDEGYEIEVRSGLLLMHHVPYVDPQRTVRYGVLVSELSLAGDVTVVPGTHVVMFSGAEPCDHLGQPLEALINSRGRQNPAPGVEVDFTFSSKPASGYPDYYTKMTTYAAILASQAQQLDPEATAVTFPIVVDPPEESVFRYADTASSRAGIGVVSHRLQDLSVAIVGLGGTGSYILDLVAKTPVREIHLYDGDKFLQHNAFRSPGAASREDLEEAPNKALHFAAVYDRMRRGVIAHPVYVDATSLMIARVQASEEASVEHVARGESAGSRAVGDLARGGGSRGTEPAGSGGADRAASGGSGVREAGWHGRWGPAGLRSFQGVPGSGAGVEEELRDGYPAAAGVLVLSGCAVEASDRAGSG